MQVQIPSFPEHVRLVVVEERMVWTCGRLSCCHAIPSMTARARIICCGDGQCINT